MRPQFPCSVNAFMLPSGVSIHIKERLCGCHCTNDLKVPSLYCPFPCADCSLGRAFYTHCACLNDLYAVKRVPYSTRRSMDSYVYSPLMSCPVLSCPVHALPLSSPETGLILVTERYVSKICLSVSHTHFPLHSQGISSTFTSLNQHVLLKNIINTKTNITITKRRSY